MKCRRDGHIRAMVLPASKSYLCLSFASFPSADVLLAIRFRRTATANETGRSLPRWSPTLLLTVHVNRGRYPKHREKRKERSPMVPP